MENGLTDEGKNLPCIRFYQHKTQGWHLLFFRVRNRCSCLMKEDRNIKCDNNDHYNIFKKVCAKEDCHVSDSWGPVPRGVLFLKKIEGILESGRTWVDL